MQNHIIINWYFLRRKWVTNIFLSVFLVLLYQTFNSIQCYIKLVFIFHYKHFVFKKRRLKSCPTYNIWNCHSINFIEIWHIVCIIIGNCFDNWPSFQKHFYKTHVSRSKTLQFTWFSFNIFKGHFSFGLIYKLFHDNSGW